MDKTVQISTLHRWLYGAMSFVPCSIALMHVKTLSLIIRDGESPDEDRLLDEDTWPEVMRQASTSWPKFVSLRSTIACAPSAICSAH